MNYFYKVNEAGEVEHYIEGVLRATMPKSSFDEYSKAYPDEAFAATL